MAAKTENEYNGDFSILRDPGNSAMADYGREIPLLLIEAVQYELFEKAYDWMQENGAPEEIIEAFSEANMLQVFASEVKAGELSDVNAFDLPYTLMNATKLAMKLGDDFMGWNTGDPEPLTWKSKGNDVAGPATMKSPEPARTVSCLKQHIFSDAPSPIWIDVAKALLDQYNREYLPDWVEILANGNPKSLNGVVDAVKNDIKASEKAEEGISKTNE